jgi:aryl-alcohol dehydrogenase-like predicted oxidoreductase
LNPGWFAPATLRAVQAVKELAAQAQLSLPQLALAWILRQPNVAAAIIGASRPEQIDEDAATSGARVDAALLQEAEALLANAQGTNA